MTFQFHESEMTSIQLLQKRIRGVVTVAIKIEHNHLQKISTRQTEQRENVLYEDIWYNSYQLRSGEFRSEKQREIF